MYFLLLISIAFFFRNVYADENYGADEYFYNGVEKYLSDDLEGARKDLYKAYAKDKMNQEVSSFLVKVLAELTVEKVKTGSYSEAYDYTRKAMEVSPKDKKLVKCCEIVKELKSSGLSPKKSLEELRLYQKKVDNLNKQTNLINQYCQKAEDYYKDGEYKKALKECEKVFKLDSQNQTAKQITENSQAKITEAENQKKQSSAKQKEKKPKKLPKSVKAEDTGDKEKKLAELEQDKKKMMSEYFNTGTKFYMNGRYAEAIKEWEKVLEIDPSHKQSKSAIEKAKNEQREKKKTETAKDGDTKKNKPETAAKDKNILMTEYFNKGTALYMDGRYSEAIKEWKKVLKLDPSHEQSKIVIEKAKQKQREKKKS
ncbi:tetratricopeptide repeat protein [bacterium]|nr:tetratricopeptide repeat protein [bacterium]